MITVPHVLDARTGTTWARCRVPLALAAALACGRGAAPDPAPVPDASVPATPVASDVPPWAVLAVVPAVADVSAGSALPLRAVVGGAPATDVAWAVLEGDAGGRVDASGTYVAPGRPATVHVSAARGAQQATATIEVKAGGAIALLPNPARTAPYGSVAFEAVVTGLAETGVAWSVLEGDAGGAVSATGAYAAGAHGTYHVVATSAADPLVRAVAEVEVSDDLEDFGGPILSAPTVHALWGGDPAQFGDAVAAVEGFLANVDGSPWLALVDPYLRGSKARVTFGGSAFLPGGAPGGQPAEQEVLAAVCAALDARGITPRSEDVYLLFSPVVETGSGYWGMHWYGPCHGVPISASWIARRSLAEGCGGASPEARAATFVVSHELAEAMTDPRYFYAWATRDGREIADGCALACAPLGGGAYAVGALWSNATHGCADR